jgi:hypothetical protein
VARGLLATAGGICKPDPLLVLNGLGDDGQQCGVDGRAAAPGRGFGRGAQRIDLAAEAWRHDAHDLGQRPDRRLLDAGHGAVGSGAQANRERDGFVVVEQQRWQRGARGKLVTALDPALGVDRIAEDAQAIDVAAEGAIGDLESLGELGARPEAMGLQQRQEAQHARAGVRHGSASIAR